MNRRFKSLSLLLLSTVVTVVVLTGSSRTTVAATNAVAVRRPGRVLIIRGIFTVFSFGLDDLACQLSQRGYRVDVAPSSMALIAAQTIEQECRNDPSMGPLAIIGHSMGGRFCCTIPWKWRQSGIPIKLVVILDSNPNTAVADNVERCVNLYVTNKLGVFHGRVVKAVDPRTDVVNLDMTKVTRPPGVPAINHFNIDDSAWIHTLVIEEVERSFGAALGSTPQLHRAAPLEPRIWKEVEQASAPRVRSASN